ncbi:MAG: rhodanese-like domain-containing protein [Proteobacteria bacterium]|nr:rhodanese-like domain-containing protein [Pseudomonadota bacterium]MBU1687321.1 rhodanese-like domain-containing protein [Pseudomonadota bacterium]
MKKLVLIICTAFLAFAQYGMAAEYQYVSAEELKGWLEAARPVLLVDIQEKQDFAAHHIKGSLETNAYPVKSDAERQTIYPAISQAKNYEAVVVVCPRGKGGAKRTYDYLKEQGVPEAKLSILTGGMEKWPYEEWVVTK